MEEFIGWGSGWISSGMEAIHADPTLTSLVVDGIIAGVGGILSFLPNIFILFLACLLYTSVFGQPQKFRPKGRIVHSACNWIGKGNMF